VKINTTIGGVSGTTGKDAPAKAKRGADSGKSSSGDSVSIGARSANLAAAESNLADVPIADTAKIQAVSDALADGSFEVDSEVVADRMIETAKENLRARK
jgi:negative regulator of flagellin synthesis FlgM